MSVESVPEPLRPKKFGLRKLVRSKILTSMLEKGQKVDFVMIADNTRRHLDCMEDKTVEEAHELRLDPSDLPSSLEELADLQQLIKDSLTLLGSTPEQLEKVRAEKELIKGGFLEGVFIRSVVVDPTIHPEDYAYLDTDPRYEEVIDSTGSNISGNLPYEQANHPGVNQQA